MANPFFRPQMQGVVPGFIEFMQSMKGQNPQAILNNLLSSGKINQNQLNVARQKAKEISGAFEGFRIMLGSQVYSPSWCTKIDSINIILERKN